MATRKPAPSPNSFIDQLDYLRSLGASTQRRPADSFIDQLDRLRALAAQQTAQKAKPTLTPTPTPTFTSAPTPAPRPTFTPAPRPALKPTVEQKPNQQQTQTAPPPKPVNIWESSTWMDFINARAPLTKAMANEAERLAITSPKTTAPPLLSPDEIKKRNIQALISGGPKPIETPWPTVNRPLTFEEMKKERADKLGVSLDEAQRLVQRLKKGEDVPVFSGLLGPSIDEMHMRLEQERQKLRRHPLYPKDKPLNVVEEFLFSVMGADSPWTGRALYDRQMLTDPNAPGYIHALKWDARPTGLRTLDDQVMSGPVRDLDFWSEYLGPVKTTLDNIAESWAASWRKLTTIWGRPMPQPPVYDVSRLEDPNLPLAERLAVVEPSKPPITAYYERLADNIWQSGLPIMQGIVSTVGQSVGGLAGGLPFVGPWIRESSFQLVSTLNALGAWADYELRAPLEKNVLGVPLRLALKDTDTQALKISPLEAIAMMRAGLGGAFGQLMKEYAKEDINWLDYNQAFLTPLMGAAQAFSRAFDAEHFRIVQYGAYNIETMLRQEIKRMRAERKFEGAQALERLIRSGSYMDVDDLDKRFKLVIDYIADIDAGYKKRDEAMALFEDATRKVAFTREQKEERDRMLLRSAMLMAEASEAWLRNPYELSAEAYDANRFWLDVLQPIALVDLTPALLRAGGVLDTAFAARIKKTVAEFNIDFGPDYLAKNAAFASEQARLKLEKALRADKEMRYYEGLLAKSDPKDANYARYQKQYEAAARQAKKLAEEAAEMEIYKNAAISDYVQSKIKEAERKLAEELKLAEKVEKAKPGRESVLSYLYRGVKAAASDVVNQFIPAAVGVFMHVATKEDAVIVLQALKDPKRFVQGVTANWTSPVLKAASNYGVDPIRFATGAFNSPKAQKGWKELIRIVDEFIETAQSLEGGAGPLDKLLFYTELSEAVRLQYYRDTAVATAKAYLPFGTDEVKLIKPKGDETPRVAYYNEFGRIIKQIPVPDEAVGKRIVDEIKSQLSGKYTRTNYVEAVGDFLRKVVAVPYIGWNPANLIQQYMHPVMNSIFGIDGGVSVFGKSRLALRDLKSIAEHTEKLYGSSGTTMRDLSPQDFAVYLGASKERSFWQILQRPLGKYYTNVEEGMGLRFKYDATVKFIQEFGPELMRNRVMPELIALGVPEELAGNIAQAFFDAAYVGGYEAGLRVVNELIDQATPALTLSQIDPEWSSYLSVSAAERILNSLKQSFDPLRASKVVDEIVKAITDGEQEWLALLAPQPTATRRAFTAADALQDFQELKATYNDVIRLLEGDDYYTQRAAITEQYQRALASMKENFNTLDAFAARIASEASLPELNKVVFGLWSKMHEGRAKIFTELDALARKIHAQQDRSLWAKEYWPTAQKLWMQFYDFIRQEVAKAENAIVKRDFAEYAKVSDDLFSLVERDEALLREIIENAPDESGKNKAVNAVIKAAREYERLWQKRFAAAVKQTDADPLRIFDEILSAESDIAQRKLQIRSMLNEAATAVSERLKQTEGADASLLWTQYFKMRNESWRNLFLEYIPARWQTAIANVLGDEKAAQTFTAYARPVWPDELKRLKDVIRRNLSGVEFLRMESDFYAVPSALRRYIDVESLAAEIGPILEASDRSWKAVAENDAMFNISDARIDGPNLVFSDEKTKIPLDAIRVIYDGENNVVWRADESGAIKEALKRRSRKSKGTPPDVSLELPLTNEKSQIGWLEALGFENQGLLRLTLETALNLVEQSAPQLRQRIALAAGQIADYLAHYAKFGEEAMIFYARENKRPWNKFFNDLDDLARNTFNKALKDAKEALFGEDAALVDFIKAGAIGERGVGERAAIAYLKIAFNLSDEEATRFVGFLEKAPTIFKDAEKAKGDRVAEILLDLARVNRLEFDKGKLAAWIDHMENYGEFVNSSAPYLRGVLFEAIENEFFDAFYAHLLKEAEVSKKAASYADEFATWLNTFEEGWDGARFSDEVRAELIRQTKLYGSSSISDKPRMLFAAYVEYARTLYGLYAEAKLELSSHLKSPTSQSYKNLLARYFEHHYRPKEGSLPISVQSKVGPTPDAYYLNMLKKSAEMTLEGLPEAEEILSALKNAKSFDDIPSNLLPFLADVARERGIRYAWATAERGELTALASFLGEIYKSYLENFTYTRDEYFRLMRDGVKAAEMTPNMRVPTPNMAAQWAIERLRNLQNNLLAEVTRVREMQPQIVAPDAATRAKAYMAQDLRLFWDDLLSAANKVGDRMRSFTMVDFWNRTRVDEFLQLFYAFPFWRSRDLKNAFERTMRNPEFVMHVHRFVERLDNLSRGEGRENEPRRLEGRWKLFDLPDEFARLFAPGEKSDVPVGLYMFLLPTRFFPIITDYLNHRPRYNVDNVDDNPMINLALMGSRVDFSLYPWLAEWLQSVNGEGKTPVRIIDWTVQSRLVAWATISAMHPRDWDKIPSALRPDWFEHSVARELENMAARKEIDLLTLGLAMDYLYLLYQGKGLNEALPEWQNARPEQKEKVWIALSMARTAAANKQLLNGLTGWFTGAPLQAYDKTESDTNWLQKVRSGVYYDPISNPLGSRPAGAQMTEGSLALQARDMKRAVTDEDRVRPGVQMASQMRNIDMLELERLTTEVTQAAVDALLKENPKATASAMNRAKVAALLPIAYALLGAETVNAFIEKNGDPKKKGQEKVESVSNYVELIRLMQEYVKSQTPSAYTDKSKVAPPPWTPAGQMATYLPHGSPWPTSPDPKVAEAYVEAIKRLPSPENPRILREEHKEQAVYLVNDLIKSPEYKPGKAKEYYEELRKVEARRAELLARLLRITPEQAKALLDDYKYRFMSEAERKRREEILAGDLGLDSSGKRRRRRSRRRSRRRYYRRYSRRRGYGSGGGYYGSGEGDADFRSFIRQRRLSGVLMPDALRAPAAYRMRMSAGRPDISMSYSPRVRPRIPAVSANVNLMRPSAIRVASYSPQLSPSVPRVAPYRMTKAQLRAALRDRSLLPPIREYLRRRALSGGLWRMP